MHLEWILHPAVQCSLQAAGLGLCVYLFLTLKHESQNAELRSSSRQQAIEASLERLGTAVEEIESRLREAEERTGMLVAPPPPPSGLNLSKRSQALRMHRRGESPQKIAASLTLPQREVELLVKVQRIVMKEG